MDSTLLLISSSKSYDHAAGNKFGATQLEIRTLITMQFLCATLHLTESMMHTPHAPSYMASFYGHPGKGRTEL